MAPRQPRLRSRVRDAVELEQGQHGQQNGVQLGADSLAVGAHMDRVMKSPQLGRSNESLCTQEPGMVGSEAAQSAAPHVL